MSRIQHAQVSSESYNRAVSVIALGLNHTTAPLDLRGRFAFAPDQLPLALRGFRERLQRAMPEAALVSTCNRTELYVAVKPQQAEELVRPALDWLAEQGGVTGSHLQDHTYVREDQEAARHAFRVASGLDSMVLGETEIFGQVKAAYKIALETGTTGRALNKLFQQAFTVGKRVRNDTMIQRGSTSVDSVAVDLAEKVHDLKECRVMLIGAGEMSRTCAQSLLSRGAKSIIVSNRSYDKAVELASEMKGSAIKFDEWEQAMHEVDVIISSTSAPHFVIKPEQIEQVMRKRRWQPLLIIDIAVPRDVDPAVNQLEGVYLYDVDALQAIANDGGREREQLLLAAMTHTQRHVPVFVCVAVPWEVLPARHHRVVIDPLHQRVAEHSHLLWVS